MKEGTLPTIGLSPRVRGNLDRLYRRPTTHRSIPACAGEPWTLSPGTESLPVYPRVCGGTSAAPASRSIPPGLSPRVRGNRINVERFAMDIRSIPACAGEPAVSMGTRRYCAVYPRVCGGTLPAIPSLLLFWGLSPRVRGNPGLWGRRGKASGSIPACAGEPRRLVCQPRFAEVYPRVCGGTSVAPIGARTIRGLSPRVRGNRRE